MKFTQPLKRNNEFRRLYSRGKSAVTAYVVVYVRGNSLGANRLGITASKKLGKAVTRNRARRRLRELYRLEEPHLKKGLDIVLVARGRTAEADYSALREAFRGALAGLGVISAGEDPGPKQ